MNKEEREELKQAIDVVSGIEVSSEYEQIGKCMLISYAEFLLDNYDNLIKYLEDKIKECQHFMNDERRGFHNYATERTKRNLYQGILERVRNNNYESK